MASLDDVAADNESIPNCNCNIFISVVLSTLVVILFYYIFFYFSNLSWARFWSETQSGKPAVSPKREIRKLKKSLSNAFFTFSFFFQKYTSRGETSPLTPSRSLSALFSPEAETLRHNTAPNTCRVIRTQKEGGAKWEWERGNWIPKGLLLSPSLTVVF